MTKQYNIWICPSCGRENYINHRRCNFCGQADITNDQIKSIYLNEIIEARHKLNELEYKRMKKTRVLYLLVFFILIGLVLLAMIKNNQLNFEYFIKNELPMFVRRKAFFFNHCIIRIREPLSTIFHAYNKSLFIRIGRLFSGFSYRLKLLALNSDRWNALMNGIKKLSVEKTIRRLYETFQSFHK